MKLIDLKSKIKSITMVTDMELTAVFVILLGLVVGLVYKNFILSQEPDFSNYSMLEREALITAVNQHFLDSVSGVREKTVLQPFEQEEGTIRLASSSELTSIKPKTQTTEKAVTQKININTASRVQLMKLPGIGEKTANKIIEYRKNNTFQRIEDIKKVHGIGEKKFDKMKDLIEVK